MIGENTMIEKTVRFQKEADRFLSACDELPLDTGKE